MKHVILFLAAPLFFVSVASAQFSQDSIQVQAWTAFDKRHPGKQYVRWNDDTGTPATIYGFESAPYTALATPEAVARQFLKDNRAIFRVEKELPNLVLTRTLEVEGVSHVDFQQTYHGIPVLWTKYTVALDSEKRVHMAGGRYFPKVVAPTTPVISEGQAIAAAMSHLDVESRPESISSELVIVPEDNRFYLGYRLGLSKWNVFVNAVTGKVESYHNRVRTLDGTGNVYLDDPVNSSLTPATLERLNGDGSTLNGIYVKATNQESGDIVNALRNFQYSPPSYTSHDDTHFDDANVYYHIDQFAGEYLPSIGFLGIGRQILATVHADDWGPCQYNGHDNAGLCPGDDNLYFGHGASTFWDLSKKDDVIYHEYTHAVSDHLGLIYSGESAAMHEGYSDYFAATYTGDAEIGEWVTRNHTNLRTLATSPSVYNYSNYGAVSYPNNSAGTPHANSMIWSGALWDLRNALGATVTDRLVYLGLTYKSGLITFLDGRDGIVLADQQYYGGAHINTIEGVFAARGIGPAPPPSFTVTIIGATSLNIGQTGTFTAGNITGGELPFTFKWYVYRNCGIIEPALPCRDWVQTGHTTQQIEYDDEVSFTLRVEVTDEYGATTSDEHFVEVVDGAGKTGLAAIPKAYALYSNYPNPFNPTTEIRFDLPEASHVRLVVYDALGREVRRLVDGSMQAGAHHVSFDAGDLPSGVYLYRITAGEFTQVQRMVLAK